MSSSSSLSIRVSLQINNTKARVRLTNESWFWAGVCSIFLLFPQVSGEQLYADVAKDILRYVSRDLSDKVNHEEDICWRAVLSFQAE